MVVAVKTEQRTRLPTVAHRPKSGTAVACIEYIDRINEEELPFLIIIVILPYGTGCVQCILDPASRPAQS